MLDRSTAGHRSDRTSASEQVRVAEPDRYAMPFDQPEDTLGAHIVWDDDGAADEEHGQDVDAGASDAEERSDCDRDVVAAEVGAGEDVGARSRWRWRG